MLDDDIPALTTRDPDAPEDAVLLAVALDAVAAIEGADHASVLIAGTPRCVATSATAEILDTYQQSIDAGPTIAAIRNGRVARINHPHDPEWQELSAVCAEHDIASIAAFPIAADGKVVGALTVSSSDYHAFGAIEIRVGLTAASLAARAFRA